MPWTLTVRAEARVRKEHYDELTAALDAVEAEARAMARSASGKPIDAKIRRFEPVQIVTGRVEISGPQRLVADVHAGLDVRGDGSMEAFVGRVRKRVVDQRPGEDALAALRRELTERASSR